MRQTSIEAYQNARPKFPCHYKLIKMAILSIKKPCTSKEIAQKCQLSYHQVARRLSEMRERGMIREHGIDTSGTRSRILWEVVNE